MAEVAGPAACKACGCKRLRPARRLRPRPGLSAKTAFPLRPRLTGDDVAAAERDLADFDAVDHLLEMMPGPVESGEAAHERRMQYPDLHVQGHQGRRGPFPAAGGYRCPRA